MKLPFWLRGWRVFGIYGLIVSGLVWQLCQLRAQNQLAEAQFQNLQTALSQRWKALDHAHFWGFGDNGSKVRENATEANQQIGESATLLLKSVRKLGDFVYCELAGVDDYFDYRLTDAAPSLKIVFADSATRTQFRQKRVALADTLRLFARENPRLLADIDSVFSEADDVFERHWPTDFPERQAVLLDAFFLKIYVLADRTIRHLGERVEPFPVANYLPAVETNRNCLRVGDTLKARFYVFACAPLDTAWAWRVENEVVLPEKGIARFRRVYRTPGAKRVSFYLTSARHPEKPEDYLIREIELNLCQ